MCVQCKQWMDDLHWFPSLWMCRCEDFRGIHYGHSDCEEPHKAHCLDLAASLPHPGADVNLYAVLCWSLHPLWPEPHQPLCSLPEGFVWCPVLRQHQHVPRRLFVLSTGSRRLCSAGLPVCRVRQRRCSAAIQRHPPGCVQRAPPARPLSVFVSPQTLCALEWHDPRVLHLRCCRGRADGLHRSDLEDLQDADAWLAIDRRNICFKDFSFYVCLCYGFTVVKGPVLWSRIWVNELTSGLALDFWYYNSTGIHLHGNLRWTVNQVRSMLCWDRRMSNTSCNYTTV